MLMGKNKDADPFELPIPNPFPNPTLLFSRRENVHLRWNWHGRSLRLESSALSGRRYFDLEVSVAENVGKKSGTKTKHGRYVFLLKANRCLYDLTIVTHLLPNCLIRSVQRQWDLCHTGLKNWAPRPVKTRPILTEPGRAASSPVPQSAPVPEKPRSGRTVPPFFLGRIALNRRCDGPRVQLTLCRRREASAIGAS